MVSEPYVIENYDGSDTNSVINENDENYDSDDIIMYNIEPRNNNNNIKKRKILIAYNEEQEKQDEALSLHYQLYKDSNEWLFAKEEIKNLSNQFKTDSVFLWDLLEKQFTINNDDFDNIKTIYYQNTQSSQSSLSNVYEFNTTISKYFIDNMKVPIFKSKGYIFNSNHQNLNKFQFKLVVITSKTIYSINRYVDETTLGCF